MIITFLIGSVLLANFCLAIPLPKGNEPVIKCRIKGSPISIDNGLIDQNARWNTFFVHPDKSFNETQLRMIEEVVWDLQAAVPCMLMGIIEPNGTPNPNWDYIYIHSNGPFCESHVGRKGGPQEVIFADHCWDHSTMTHELMHALGFHHEQNRPDRDEYVDIIWGNIVPFFRSQFDKNLDNETTTFGLPYDFHSVMHYRAFEASWNGEDTIVAKNGESIGPASKLTDLDIQKLRRMYNCTDNLP